jgi:hypothetical protein
MRQPWGVVGEPDRGTGAEEAEIAKELFVSIKTVGTHVSSVLHKLQISTRHQPGLDRMKGHACARPRPPRLSNLPGWKASGYGFHPADLETIGFLDQRHPVPDSITDTGR